MCCCLDVLYCGRTVLVKDMPGAVAWMCCRNQRARPCRSVRRRSACVWGISAVVRSMGSFCAVCTVCRLSCQNSTLCPRTSTTNLWQQRFCDRASSHTHHRRSVGLTGPTWSLSVVRHCKDRICTYCKVVASADLSTRFVRHLV